MASSKQKLQGLIGTPPAIQKGTPYTVLGDATSSPPPVETGTIHKGAPFIVSTADSATELLPAAVLALRSELCEIARSYIGARRRSGRALLEAARWLSEARTASEHGEWYDFLAATDTTADTAERLLRIYDRSIQHAAFAAAVADGRLNQSAAERLARNSTPTAVIDVVLTAEKAPTITDVDRAIRAARQPVTSVREKAATPQIPQIPQTPQIPQFAGFAGQPSLVNPAIQVLREAAALLNNLALQYSAALPAGEETNQLVTAIEQSLITIRRAIVEQHTSASSKR